MDPHGVPRKINRHVMKAVHFYTCQQDGSSFPEIYNYVKLCNKNQSPVLNLKDTVRKSLNTFSRVGVVMKDRQQRFRLHSAIRAEIPTKNKPKKKQQKENEPRESNETAETASKRKRRKGSDSSLDTENEGSASKRMRGGKKKTVSERKGKKADLPRARRHAGGSGGSNMPSNNTALNASASDANFSEKIDLQKDTEGENSTEFNDSVETFDVASEAETAHSQSNDNNEDDPQVTNDVSEKASRNDIEDNQMTNDNEVS